VKSKITEREVAAELAAELDSVIQQGGVPFQKATVEHSAEGLYPDIVIWTNYAAKQAFAFWELKAPPLREDLSKLPAKAQALGVRYAVIWNFQSGELYEIEGGHLRPRKSYPTPLLNSLEEWVIPSKRFAVVNQARKILDDLNRLAQGQSLMPFVPDRFYFIGILQKAIMSMLPVLQEHLFQKKKKKAVRDQINAWAVKQGYPTALPNLDELLARHWAYSLAVRILFYFTIRRYYPSLPDLRPAPGSAQSVATLLQDAFSKAQTVDWQAVFEPSPLDALGLPETVDSILRELLHDFHRYDFSQLKEDVVGQILEGLIPEEERHALGQYFTREDLVDFIIGFVAHDDQGPYLDPTCGSGTFLNRLYSRLRWLSAYRATHGELLERIWGVDIAHFPAELATINLFRQAVKDLTNFPRIVVQDFFLVRPGQTFSFPPLRVTTPDYPKIQVQMPMFRGIVGNFPYIRQELIERQNKGYKREIVQAIAQEWFWKDRNLFEVKGISAVEVEEMQKKGTSERQKWLQNQVRAGHIDLRLSGQADIYAYLFYHAAAFLEQGGRLGVVTSNAWLDVAYGEELKRFFLRHFKIIAVVASWSEPWFEDSDVNTAFTILERCEDPAERAQNIVRFVKVRKPLSEILPRDLLLQEAERWRKVDALVREIECADTQVTAWDVATGQVQSNRGVHTLELDDLRIRLVPQAELEAELQAKASAAKWGLYIRAPQVYFDLLQEAGDKFVPLSQVAEVRFGIKTGINDFFYLEPLGPGRRQGTVRVQNSRNWVGEIEEDLLKPALLSLKEVKTLALSGEEARWLLFLCPHTRNELQARGYLGALNYIRWGEQQRTGGRGRVGTRGVPFPQVSSVRSHRPEWFNLPVRKPGQLVSNRFIGERFGFLINSGFAISDTFFEISFPADEDLYAALLNSTVTFLFVELTGRQTWTQGVLYLYGPELRELPVPDASRIPTHLQERIIKEFDKLKRRSVKPIAQEVKQKDRRALDAAVLEALELDPARYQQRLYEGLVEMVRERLALAKLRTIRKRRERRLSLEQVKAYVQQEVLPSGLKPITAFLPSSKPMMMEVNVTGRPRSWRSFFNQFTLIDSDGKEVGVLEGDEFQARYAIYAARPGHYMIEVPADPAVACKIVQDYEQYLRHIGQALFQRALDATHDHKQAERIVWEILDSLGLPSLAMAVVMGR